MQIVIDIPEHYYENNIKKELPICLTEEQVVGILPKGHGRLIDADALLEEINQFDYYDNVKDAPTIIEAERSKE